LQYRTKGHGTSQIKVLEQKAKIFSNIITSKNINGIFINSASDGA
jgi:hypothetical protein